MKVHCDTLPLGTQSPHTIGILLETILKNNNLSFMDMRFLQLVHTAMETQAAHSHMPTFSWTATKKPSAKPLSGQSSSKKGS